MNIAFSSADLGRLSIGLYVLVWLGFVCYLHIYSRRKNVNVHKVAKWYSMTVAIRHWGWFVGLVGAVILTWILPDIYVVTQNPERTKMKKMEYANKWAWADTTFTLNETFHVDEYYVLFSYQGFPCSAGNSYLLNKTDSTLILYYTNFYNGQFTSVSGIREFETFPPGHFQQIEGDINNKFRIPRESSVGKVSKNRENKKTTEWTISLARDAIDDTKEIREKIKERNYLYNEYFDRTRPYRSKTKAPDEELNQLIRFQDAKQKSH